MCPPEAVIPRRHRKRLRAYIKRDKVRSVRRFFRARPEWLEGHIDGPSQRTSLHVAAHQGSMDCIQELVALGASCVTPDQRGNFPLYYALKFCLKQRCGLDTVVDLVRPLQLASQLIMGVSNRKGLSCHDLQVALEEELETQIRLNRETDPPGDGDSPIRGDEGPSWAEKLTWNAQDDLYESTGSFSASQSVPEPDPWASGETFDTWADRIGQEFQDRRRRKARSEAHHRHTSENPEPAPSVFQPNLQLKASPVRGPSRYGKFRRKLLSTEEELTVASLPFDCHTPPTQVVEEILAELKDAPLAPSAAMWRDLLREELRLWHPDKFQQKFRARFHPDEVSDIMELVKHVTQSLLSYGR